MTTLFCLSRFIAGGSLQFSYMGPIFSLLRFVYPVLIYLLYIFRRGRNFSNNSRAYACWLVMFGFRDYMETLLDLCLHSCWRYLAAPTVVEYLTLTGRVNLNLFFTSRTITEMTFTNNIGWMKFPVLYRYNSSRVQQHITRINPPPRMHPSCAILRSWLNSYPTTGLIYWTFMTP